MAGAVLISPNTVRVFVGEGVLLPRLTVQTGNEFTSCSSKELKEVLGLVTDLGDIIRLPLLLSSPVLI